MFVGKSHDPATGCFGWTPLSGYTPELQNHRIVGRMVWVGGDP